MPTREQLFNLIFIFVATAALGAILGLSVLRTVDHRLSDVSINIPPIKVPESNVRIEWPENMLDELKHELLGSRTDPNAYDNGSNPPYQELRAMTGGGLDQLPTTVGLERSGAPQPDGEGILESLSENIGADNQAFRRTVRPIENDGVADTLPPADRLIADSNPMAPPGENLRQILDSPDFQRGRDRINNSNYYLASQQLESHRVSNYPPIHPHRSHQDIDHYEANRQHLGRPQKRSRKCQPHQLTPSGVYWDQPCDSRQYYKDPSEMTTRQLIKFKKYAKFDKMTLRDYLNWLTLYSNEPEILTPQNAKNLKRLKGGKRIRERDIPSDRRLPKSSRELYEQLYDENY
jgi:hypothetical protein